MLARTLRSVPRKYASLRFLSDSHSDFESKSKVPDDDDVQKFLKTTVQAHDVILFMKGSPKAPQCGFSAKVSQILKNEGVDFSSADVLSSAEIRNGIKTFSNWPTIPQLYVKGEFVGGCDIVTEMHTLGELKELLEPIVTEQKKKKEEKA